MRGRVLEVTTRPNAPHGATSRRIRAALGLVADETEVCRWDARRRGQEDERVRDRVIVQVRPRALDFFQLAQDLVRRWVRPLRAPAAIAGHHARRRKAS